MAVCSSEGRGTRLRRLTRAAALLVLVLSPPLSFAASNEVRVAVLDGLATPDCRTVSDLSCVRLSRSSGLHVVERELLDRILKEQELSGISATRDEAVRLGRLLSAQVFAVVAASRAERAGWNADLVVFDVSTGLRLQDTSLAGGSADELAAGLAQAVEFSCAKFRTAKNLKLIAAVPARRTGATTGLSFTLEHAIVRIVARMLAQQQGIAVLEREHAEALLRERTLRGLGPDAAADPAGLLSAAHLVEMELTTADVTRETCTLRCWLRKDTRMLALYSGPLASSNLLQVASAITAAAVRQVNGAPAAKPATIPAGLEADRFAEEARLRLAHGRLTEALDPAASALMLAPRDSHTNLYVRAVASYVAGCVSASSSTTMDDVRRAIEAMESLESRVKNDDTSLRVSFCEAFKQKTGQPFDLSDMGTVPEFTRLCDLVRPWRTLPKAGPAPDPQAKPGDAGSAGRKVVPPAQPSGWGVGYLPFVARTPTGIVCQVLAQGDAPGGYLAGLVEADLSDAPDGRAAAVRQAFVLMENHPSEYVRRCRELCLLLRDIQTGTDPALISRRGGELLRATMAAGITGLSTSVLRTLLQSGCFDPKLVDEYTEGLRQRKAGPLDIFYALKGLAVDVRSREGPLEIYGAVVREMAAADPLNTCHFMSQEIAATNYLPQVAGIFGGRTRRWGSGGTLAAVAEAGENTLLFLLDRNQLKAFDTETFDLRPLGTFTNAGLLGHDDSCFYVSYEGGLRILALGSLKPTAVLEGLPGSANLVARSGSHLLLHCVADPGRSLIAHDLGTGARRVVAQSGSLQPANPIEKLPKWQVSDLRAGPSNGVYYVQTSELIPNKGEKRAWWKYDLPADSWQGPVPEPGAGSRRLETGIAWQQECLVHDCDLFFMDMGGGNPGMYRFCTRTPSVWRAVSEGTPIADGFGMAVAKNRFLLARFTFKGEGYSLLLCDLRNSHPPVERASSRASKPGSTEDLDALLAGIRGKSRKDLVLMDLGGKLAALSGQIPTIPTELHAKPGKPEWAKLNFSPQGMAVARFPQAAGGLGLVLLHAPDAHVTPLFVPARRGAEAGIMDMEMEDQWKAADCEGVKAPDGSVLSHWYARPLFAEGGMNFVVLSAQGPRQPVYLTALHGEYLAPPDAQAGGFTVQAQYVDRRLQHAFAYGLRRTHTPEELLTIGLQSGNRDLVEWAVGQGANLRKPSGLGLRNEVAFPLEAACFFRDFSMARWLMEHGASPADGSPLSALLFHGRSALDLQALPVMALLIQKGANVNNAWGYWGRDQKAFPPLFHAIDKGLVGCSKRLLELGARPGDSHREWDLAGKRIEELRAARPGPEWEAVAKAFYKAKAAWSRQNGGGAQ